MDAKRIVLMIQETLEGFTANYRNPVAQVSDTTESLNAEHTLGKYHALLSVLKEIDCNVYIETVAATREKARELLSIVERIYK